MSSAPEGNRELRLSVAMIVRDAEPVLDASLASVADLADEIVIADTGSRDQTRKIASEHAARVIEVPWPDDFSIARNACLAATTGDWVLWLDAGETLDKETMQAIRQWIATDPEPTSVVRFMIEIPPSPGDLSPYQISQARLMPRRSGLRFHGRVRETLDGTVAELGLEQEQTSWTIHRALRTGQVEVQLLRARRNLALAELGIRDGDDPVRLTLVRAEALAQLGERAEARSAYVEAQHLAPRGSDAMLDAIYGELASYEGEPKGREVQLDLCIEALRVFPNDLQLLCAMGSYLQSQQRIDLAIRAFQTAIGCGEIHRNVWHLAHIGDIAIVCLASALQSQDSDDEALVVLEEGLAQRPASIAMRHQLIELHIRHGRRKEAVEQVPLLPVDVPRRESLANAVRGACLAGRQEWIAAQAYLVTAYEGGCRDPICLQALAGTWKALEKSTELKSLLAEWRRVEPDSEEIARYAEVASSDSIPGPITDSTVLNLGGPGSSRHFRVHQPGPGEPIPMPRPKSEPTKNRAEPTR